MKSKLVSIPRTNLLYLPILKINGLPSDTKTYFSTGGFEVTVDANTTNLFTGGDNTSGILNGLTPTEQGNFIRIDQGLDTTEISSLNSIDSDLLETQYIIQIDHRLGVISPIDTGADASNYSFIDDDDIATYYFGIGDAGGIVQSIDYFAGARPDDNRLTDKANITPFDGPLGTNVRFKIRSSELLRQSDLLFNEIGGGASTTTLTKSTGGSTSGLRFIDSIVRVTGVTTGYSLDIPVRFLKK